MWVGFYTFVVPVIRCYGKGSRGQHHPQKHGEFQASHGNKNTLSQKKKENKNKHKDVTCICFMKITVGGRQPAL